MKKITIERDENGIVFSCDGFDSFEAMGILRYYEKKIWMDTVKNNKTSIVESSVEIKQCSCLEPTISTAVGVCGKCGLISDMLLNSGKL